MDLEFGVSWKYYFSFCFSGGDVDMLSSYTHVSLEQELGTQRLVEPMHSVRPLKAISIRYVVKTKHIFLSGLEIRYISIDDERS